MWEKFYTTLATIERNKDGSFKRENGQKKVVFLENWKESKPKTDEQIAKHFENWHAALAMLTGSKNNITVIDFDSKDNELMMELYQVAPTKVIETEKGFHLYYKFISDEAFYTKAGAFGEGVDCRNGGGVIFCPPTPNYHPWGERIIEVITPEGIELLKSKAQGKKKIDLVRSTTRNDDLFRMACGWVEHYEKEAVWSKMVKANREFHKGELEDDELEKIYQQAVNYQKTGQKPEDAEKYRLISLDQVSDEADDEPRYSTGIRALDTAMRDEDYFGTGFQGGMALGELIAIAGRPGNGKTLLAAHFTASVQKQGIRSLWFSYEAKLKKLKRIFNKLGANNSMISGIDIDKNIPMLGNVNWLEKYIAEAVGRGVKMVVIDNLDFLETRNDRTQSYSQNQQAYLHSIVSELTKIAIQYQIILILIAHVRKPTTQTLKAPKRPFLYDIAGTSAVERLCSFGLIVEREADDEENYSDRSYVYLDKNRESGVRKKVAMDYKAGKLVEEGSELLEAAKLEWNAKEIF